MKRCSDCQEMKPFGAFFKDRSHNDGYQSWCKACRGKAQKRKRYDERKKTRKDYLPSFRIVYCPLNSWTDGSSFTRTEIDEMLAMEHLAIGTRFRRNGAEYIVDCYSYGKLRLVRI